MPNIHPGFLTTEYPKDTAEAKIFQMSSVCICTHILTHIYIYTHTYKRFVCKMMNVVMDKTLHSLRRQDTGGYRDCHTAGQRCRCTSPGRPQVKEGRTQAHTPPPPPDPPPDPPPSETS